MPGVCAIHRPTATLPPASAGRGDVHPPVPGCSPLQLGLADPARLGVARMRDSGGATLQGRLTVSQAGDAHELEADHMAARVMQMPSGATAVDTATEPGIHVAPAVGDGGRHEDSVRLQRAQLQPGHATPMAGQAPPIVRGVLGTPGQPLEPAVRGFFEPRFAYDFSKVRVHVGEQAATSARMLGARAYTVGSDIVFAAGAFCPGTAAGRRLLAHELAHTVQQNGGADPGVLIQRIPDYSTSQTNVEGSGLTRKEVHGLRYGIDQDFYDDPESVERDKTAESARQMAVIFFPDALAKEGAAVRKDPVIILHFHGFGFRKNEPFAGDRVSKDRGGKVRDLDQDYLEQQVGKFMRESHKDVIGVLPQGVGHSMFHAGTIPTFDYISDVLKKSGVASLVTLADHEYSVVLSAHSGGGSTQVVPMLDAREAETADRSRLTPQTPRQDGRVVDKLTHQPVQMIVLFEALNGNADVEKVEDWVKRQLAKLAHVLRRAPSPSDLQAELDAIPVLRGYYGKRKDPEETFYSCRYIDLNARICKAIDAKIPGPWQQAVRDKFRIIEVTPKDTPKGEVEHEAVISGIGFGREEGTLFDALQAGLTNLASDRDKAVACDKPIPKCPPKQDAGKRKRGP